MEDPLEDRKDAVDGAKKAEALKPRMTPLYFILVFIFALSIATISFMAGKWSVDPTSTEATMTSRTPKGTTAAASTASSVTKTTAAPEMPSTVRPSSTSTLEVTEEDIWMFAEIMSTTAEPRQHHQSRQSHESTDQMAETSTAASEIVTETVPTLSTGNVDSTSNPARTGTEDVSTVSTADPIISTSRAVRDLEDEQTTVDPLATLISTSTDHTTTQTSSGQDALTATFSITEDPTITTREHTSLIADNHPPSTTEPTTTLTWGQDDQVADLTYNVSPATTTTELATSDLPTSQTVPTSTLASWDQNGEDPTAVSTTDDNTTDTTSWAPSTSAMVTPTTITPWAKDDVATSKGDPSTTPVTWEEGTLAVDETTAYPWGDRDPLRKVIIRQYHGGWPWYHGGHWRPRPEEHDFDLELLQARREMSDLLVFINKFLGQTGGRFEDV